MNSELISALFRSFSMLFLLSDEEVMFLPRCVYVLFVLSVHGKLDITGAVCCKLLAYICLNVYKLLLVMHTITITDIS